MVSQRRASAALACILLWTGAACGAINVLPGMPDYGGAVADSGILPDAGTPADGTHRLKAVAVPSDQTDPVYGDAPVGGVPEYTWWYGCSPTSAGMLVGYWDGRPGYENLFYGDAGTWWGDGSSGTRRMVASTAHIVSGAENGYTYGTYEEGPSYPNHTAQPDCLADFMRTVDGGSMPYNITRGLKRFVAWNGPYKSGYAAATADVNASTMKGTFSYDSLKANIDADRPVLLNLRCAISMTKWVGHTVVAYGYQDDMFQVRVAMPDPNDPEGFLVADLVVGGFAVRDTWANGTAKSDWIGWDDQPFSATIIDGVEWWPFVECRGASWVYDDGTPGPYDWMLFDAITLDIVAPEPGGLTLLALSLPLLLRRRAGVARPPSGVALPKMHRRGRLCHNARPRA